MPPIRVLIVDDCPAVSRLLAETLAARGDVEVADTASSGSIALAKIPQLKPDVITLGIEMPGLDGIRTLTQIRKQYPALPVIMCSTVTERGAAVTLEALSLGASDYVTKPDIAQPDFTKPDAENLAATIAQMGQTLIEKIIFFGRRGPVGPAQIPPPQVTLQTCAPRKQPAGQAAILAIGASTGGPNALTQLIPRLPEDFPVPVVVVQHMPPLFTRSLAERLNTQSLLAVREARAGQTLEPGQVWIAPGGFHMTVAQKGTDVVIHLNQGPAEHFCRPAVDVLFRSVARVYGGDSLALVMTGMGSDGARGALQIRKAGGEVLVQDEASSVVWGMPRAVVKAGAADKICSLADLRLELVRRVAAGRTPVAGATAAART